MAILPNNAGEAFIEIKKVIAERLEMLDTSGKVWRRFRYADNAGQWLEIASITEVAGTQVLRVIFVWLNGFTSQWVESRRREITATFNIEVIQQFVDGTDDDNSTDAYEKTLGDIDNLFKTQYSLGFTDPASQEVVNSPFSASDEQGGKPAYVDGILSHRVVGSIDAVFRLC